MEDTYGTRSMEMYPHTMFVIFLWFFKVNNKPWMLQLTACSDLQYDSY